MLRNSLLFILACFTGFTHGKYFHSNRELFQIMFSHNLSHLDNITQCIWQETFLAIGHKYSVFLLSKIIFVAKKMTDEFNICIKYMFISMFYLFILNGKKRVKFCEKQNSWVKTNFYFRFFGKSFHKTCYVLLCFYMFYEVKIYDLLINFIQYFLLIFNH